VYFFVPFLIFNIAVSMYMNWISDGWAPIAQEPVDFVRRLMTNWKMNRQSIHVMISTPNAIYANLTANVKIIWSKLCRKCNTILLTFSLIICIYIKLYVYIVSWSRINCEWTCDLCQVEKHLSDCEDKDEMCAERAADGQCNVKNM